MTKQIIQIENTNGLEFKEELLNGVSALLLEFKSWENSQEKLLTREEVAEILSISLVTLWKYTKQSIIPAYRIGTKVRYKRKDVISALELMNNANNNSTETK